MRERERAVKENKDPEVDSLQNSTILINLSSRGKRRKLPTIQTRNYNGAITTIVQKFF